MIAKKSQKKRFPRSHEWKEVHILEPAIMSGNLNFSFVFPTPTWQAGSPKNGRGKQAHVASLSSALLPK